VSIHAQEEFELVTTEILKLLVTLNCVNLEAQINYWV
jgi:hypothetical protein